MVIKIVPVFRKVTLQSKYGKEKTFGTGYFVVEYPEETT